MSKFGGIIFFTIFGLFWCSLTFLFDGVIAWNLVRQLRASNYPEAQGTITHSKVNVKSDGDGTSYDPEIHYRYALSGQTYESKTIRYDFMSMGKERADALVAKYPVGQAVTVYYRPTSPGDAVLELGPGVENFFAALFLAPFNTVALFLVSWPLGSLRSRQLGRPIAGISVRNEGLTTTTIRVYERSPAMMALAVWGATGFLATFGVLLAWWAMPFEVAIALGWSATLAATISAWWYAQKKYSEFRLDGLRGRVEIRDIEGRSCSLPREDLKPLSYRRKSTTDSEGQRSERFPLELTYLDPETRESRTLTLPELTTERDAQRFTTWFNDVLGQPSNK